MFSLTYVLAELRRRAGRTVLTALGLGIGVGLVVTVTALSNGLDHAQAKVLRPLTGVGTDMAVTRPLRASGNGRDFTPGVGPGSGPPGARLDPAEREALRRENGGGRLGLRSLGRPGSHFSRDSFLSRTQLSFPASQVSQIAGERGVKAAAGALTLTSLHVEGTVPQEGGGPGGPGGGGRFGGGGPGGGPGGGAGFGGPQNIDFNPVSVTGVDQSQPSLAPVTPGQLAGGRWFSAGTGGAYEAVGSDSYARSKGLGVGSTVKLGGRTFRLVGLAKQPLGGQASDVYVELGTLQRLSNRTGRVNVVQVRADRAADVSRVSHAIEGSFPGAQVTTAKDLADRIGGSLVDAKSLSNDLGTALAIVALAAAFLIASLLTLSSVAKRIRELGTLKALGWSQRRVVGQVASESLAQGVLGGAVGVLIGIGGAALIGALAPSLTASVAQAAPVGGGRFAAAFGQGSVAAGSQSVALDAPIDIGLIALAVALALAGGLIAGAVGGLRASRLRPADALRHID